MRRSILATALGLGLALASGGPAEAQKSTEQYIPIGRSPGLSGSVTTVGRIEQVEPASRSVSVEGVGSVLVPEGARIWVDRSAQGAASLTGSLSDLVPGRQVEVKYRDPDRREAEWIKVRPE
jgi:hypothetical protein